MNVCDICFIETFDLNTFVISLGSLLLCDLCFRGTFILGLCLDIESVCGLAEVMLGQGLDYLMCYKFSQDHLELFFSAVRQCGE